MKSYLPKESEVERAWLVVDAADKVLGRLSVKIADALRGKNKPIFSPQVDTGDFVVVINAEKVKLTGNKNEEKMYQRYTGYRSGLRETKACVIRERYPERLIESAVKGMLPRNKLGRQMISKLKVYAGENHPHEAQNPTAVEML